MNSLRHHLAILLLVASVFAAAGAFAQGPRVAFVTSSRSKIYFSDGAKLDSTSVLDTASINGFLRGTLGAQGIVNVTHLATLAATADGKTMLIAGHFLYPNIASGLQEQTDAIMRIDSPFLIDKNNYLTKFKFLKKITLNVNKALPLGTITADGQNWYATWTASQPGNPQLWFYHGSMNQFDNGTATIDSVEYTTASMAPLASNFHMTNLTANPSGNYLVGVVVDNLANQVDGPAYHSFRWQPNPPAGQQPFHKADFQNLITSTFGGAVTDRDNYFGFGLRANDNSTADLILAKGITGDLVIKNYDFTTGQVKFGTNDVGSVSASLLSSNEYFFDGLGNSEVDQNALQQGNGGDIQFLGQSDSLVFVTHNSLNEQDLSKSEIMLYSQSAGTPTVLFHTSAGHMQQPLQPVFLHGTPPAPPKPGYVSLSVQSLNFGSHDFKKDSSLTVTVQNPSGKDVTLDNTTITGPQASAFSVVSNSKGKTLPFTLAAADNVVFTIKYVAPSNVETDGATFTIHFAGSVDSSRQVVLSGAATKPIVGVASRATLASNLTIAPNPFTSSTTISVQAGQSGPMQIEVRDLLGRLVFEAKRGIIASGEKSSMIFDAKSLGLANGVYYLNARFGNEVISRQLVLVR